MSRHPRLGGVAYEAGRGVSASWLYSTNVVEGRLSHVSQESTADSSLPAKVAMSGNAAGLRSPALMRKGGLQL